MNQSKTNFIRSLGDGVRKNGVRNRCPYRRCGVDTEIRYRLLFGREFSWVLPVRVASGVDTEFPYRVRIVLPALLQKLVGEFFFDFSQGNLENLVGNLEGIFRGFFLAHRTKAQKFRGKFRSIFRKKIRGSKKIFRANFTLQTCHLNVSSIARGVDCRDPVCRHRFRFLDFWR